MSFCSKCGAKLDDDAKFCQSCGASTDQNIHTEKPFVVSGSNNARLFSILAYLTPLWILGLLVKPESEDSYVRFHVNQGIMLTILWAACSVVSNILDIFFLGWIWRLVYIGIAALNILGLIYAIQGKMKSLPIIGDVHIIR